MEEQPSLIKPKSTKGTKPFSRSMVVRTIIGICMLSGFGVIIWLGKVWLIGLVILLSLGATYETIMLVFKTKNIKHSLNPVLIFLISFIGYIHHIYSPLSIAVPSLKNYLEINVFKSITFFTYTLMIIAFISNMKRKHLKAQFLMFIAANLLPYFFGYACRAAIISINTGTYFLVVPALLVIANDSFAYFFGKLFGKTMLYSLSPKKTVEGFIGGAFGTLITAMLIGFLKIKFNFLPTPYDNVLESYYLIPFINACLPVVYFVNFVFFLGASIVAPFGGFLASATKRLFKQKDFGTIFPEHGGITDRFDCHCMMIYFTHRFLRSMKRMNSSQAEALSNYILSNFSSDEIRIIIRSLSSSTQ